MAQAKTMRRWRTIYGGDFSRIRRNGRTTGGIRDIPKSQILDIQQQGNACGLMTPSNLRGCKPSSRMVLTGQIGHLVVWKMVQFDPRVLCCASVASLGDPVAMERLWHKCLQHPAEWWDTRDNKLNSKSRDLEHQITNQALWADSWNTPQWVRQVEAAVALSETTCEGGSGGTCGDRRTESIVDSRSPTGDAFSWTRIISQHAKRGHGRQALTVYDQMREKRVVPSSYTFVAALKACSSLKDLQSAKKIHAEIVQYELESDVFVGTMLVDVYSKCGSLVSARHVFERMPYRDAVSWNAMIMGYAQEEEGAEALKLYTRMQREGVVPDDRTYVGILKACSGLAGREAGCEGDGKHVKKVCLEQVKEIHTALVQRGFESDVYVGNMLVDVYSKCGSLVDARCAFVKMPRRDVVSWNAMILGYAQLEEGEEALHLYAQMQAEGVVPNDRTFVAAVKACSSLAAMEQRIQGDVMKGENGRCLDKLRGIHKDIERSGYECDVFVGNMLVDAYAKCRSLVDARRVFEAMPHRTVVSWTAMISGYSQSEQGEEGLQLFARMQQEGVTPDALSFVGALQACGSVAGLDKGKEIHVQISETGLDRSDPCVASSLIDMYGKCGSLVDAQHAFDAFPRKDNVVAWSALIAGYARQGESERVFSLFQQMRQEGVEPNGVLFSSILTLCSHAGLVDKGQMYFEAMSREFGIRPSIEHHTCMVDLLGRAGEVHRALAMAKSMPVQADGAVWKTVLGACQKWGNVEVGREAFECAVRVDEDDAAAYVLMTNIYAAAEMLEAAEEIQAMRVETRAWKQAGQSWWTDSSGSVHEFDATRENRHAKQSRRMPLGVD